MEKLAKQISGEDVFSEQTGELSAIVKEYFERNERKKEDENWLKKYRPVVISEMERLGKDKALFDDVKVSISIPDNSRFDDEKVLEFLEAKGLTDKATKRVVDEDKLSALIESGEIDLEELKEVAWVVSTGSPRLTITKVKRG